MPPFTFTLETFTRVTVDAADEAAARQCVESMLLALGHTEYAIEGAPRRDLGHQTRSQGGRPAVARAKVLRALDEDPPGYPPKADALAEATGVHRSTAYRALRRAKGEGLG